MSSHPSVRAAARRLFVEIEEGDVAPWPETATMTPTPDPSSQEPATGRAAPPARADGRGEQVVPGGGERAVHAAGPPSASADLMAQVQWLYEESALTVCEIARRAGVTERTLYKYAHKGGWQPRYAWMPDGSRPPARPGRLRWTEADARRRAQGYRPVKGAGGRYVCREDAGTPIARGIKAVDPAGRAAAAEACAEAARKAQWAKLTAEVSAARKLKDQAMRALIRAMDAVIAHRKPWRGRRWPTPDEQQADQELMEVCGSASSWHRAAREAYVAAQEALARFEAEHGLSPGHIRV